MAFDAKTYNNEHKKENYDLINFRVPKGKKTELKALAKEKGVSVNQLIIDAIAKVYGLYLGRDKP